MVSNILYLLFFDIYQMIIWLLFLLNGVRKKQADLSRDLHFYLIYKFFLKNNRLNKGEYARKNGYRNKKYNKR
jgi:hypothetical protein